MRRTIVAIETDTHGNHRFGLLNPDTTLADEDEDGRLTYYSPELTATQKALWELRTENIGKLLNLAGRDKIYYLHLGDQTQGNKYKSELVSTRLGDQFEIAAANAAPILRRKQVVGARFVHGTPSHEFGEGTTGNVLQRRYERTYPNKNIKTVWHGLATIGGVSIEYAHHGPYPGSRSWLKGNVARLHLKDKMFEDIFAGREPPDIYLYGHYHECIWETYRHRNKNQWHTSHLVIVPAMCGLSVWARKVTRSAKMVSNGMVCLELVNGKILDVHWFVQTRDIRTMEVL